ncbi:MAG: contractile injection system protein, VgrG/Pvc8 family [Roseiarcus sp.]|jgi:phage protein D
MATPVLQISIDGQDVSSKVNPRVLKGRVDRFDGEKADALELTLSNYDGMLAKPKRGATLRVALGFAEFGGAVDRGAYIIQDVTKSGGLAEFHLTGQSADLKKTLKQQKTRTWVAPKTLGAVLSQVASDNGLRAAIDAAFAALPIDPILAQTGESDMHLVMRLARRYGAVGKFAMGQLVFVPKGAGTTASGAGVPAITITPNDCEPFHIHDSDREVRGKSHAKVWDRKTATSTDKAGDAGDGGPDYAHPETFGSATEAGAAATARAKAFARAKKTIEATLRAPAPVPVPGGVVTTQGFGDDDDVDWIVKKVSDEFDGEGLVTKFEGELKV